LVVPALTLLALAVVACGGKSGGSDISGTGLKGATKSTVIKVANPTDSESPYLWMNNEVIQYMIINGFHYPVEFVPMTSAEMQQALKAGTVHLAMEVGDASTKDWFDQEVSAGTIDDYGVLYTSAEGVVYHKAASKSLATAAPDFAEAFKKMIVPATRYKAMADWVEKYNITEQRKVAVYFFWEFDYTTGGFKDWMPYDPWQDIRVETSQITRLIRGTPYLGKEPTPTPTSQ
jgi:ABC-type proline/glycine betaine transport system substrate-binding protein